MTREEIDIMWNKALQQSIKDGEEFTRYHFHALVAAAERNRTWTQDHWTEYERSIAADEREACAQTIEGFYGSREEYAAAIRARGQA